MRVGKIHKTPSNGLIFIVAGEYRLLEKILGQSRREEEHSR